jgi:uncharacterized protein
MADPLAAWLGFLATPAAPKTAMSPLELDGYLTGIIVAPQAAPILPSQWLPGLWGTDEPIFDDINQVKTALGAVMEHYNAIIAGIDRSLKRLEKDNVADYRPLFLKGGGKPAHDAVRSWVRGFGKAMALAPETWSALVEDKRVQVLIEPFIGFFDLAHHEPAAASHDDDASLDEDAALIPRVVLVLRMLAQMRSAAAPDRRTKVGRNDPCPCGSGKKYKLCCGRN